MGYPDSANSGRDPSSAGSAALDTGKAVVNTLLNVVEGGVNLIGVATPGSADYLPFMSRFRLGYDTPAFGETLEVLMPLGGLRAAGRIGAVEGGVAESDSVQLGGAHKNVKGVPGNESHHMPADSASPLSKNNGPAISMDKSDHRQTASWGSSREARAYRAEQAERIRNGDFSGAQHMDIHDIQAKFGAKYNEAIRQMVEYTKGLGF